MLGKKLIDTSEDVQNSGKMQTSRKYGIFLLHQGSYVQIIVELPTLFTVEDCIKYSLQMFNKDLGTKYTYSEFLLKVAKKSGEPKSDLPSLDSEQLLSETGAMLLTLIFVPKSDPASTETSMSIKSRTSYQSGLISKSQQVRQSLNKKPIKEQKVKEGGGFCFFRQCI